MSEYEIRFYIWPYHGVKREPERFNDGNQSVPDPKVRIKASTFADAYETAKNMLTAIRFDGRVWECGISSISAVGPR